MPWSSSDRRSRLPANWSTLVRTVKRRDEGVCQKCGRLGAEVDHIVPGDNHDLSNLQLLCSRCHRIKTLAEARRARGGSRSDRRRKTEQHPGVK